MGFLNTMGEFFSCISKPIEMVCDWVSDTSSHEKSKLARKSAHERSLEVSAAEHDFKTKEMELEVDLQVRKVREMEKAVAEIEEWKKDKEFERMERTAAAIAFYSEQLTKLNVETINAIGHMQLELKERAQQLVLEKSIQYKELQSAAVEEAMNDILRIEDKFGDNERAKDILMRAVDTKMSNIIDTSARFLEELNRDIVNLNKSIDRLTNQGQRFIENHLNRFHISDNGSPIALAEASDEKLVYLSGRLPTSDDK